MKSLLLLALLMFTVFPAPAATRQWTNTLGGDWFMPANWSPNGVPTGGDVANITSDGTYSVNILTGAVTVAVLNLGGASGTQTLLNGTTGNLAVTNAGTVGANGVLTITNGGLQGYLTIQPSGQLQLFGPAAKNLYQLVLNNEGTVTWSDGVLLGGSTPSTVISNAGMWQITGDSTFYDAYGGPSMIWDNRGTLRKAAGTATTLISGFNLINEPGGVIDVLSGTLSLNGDTNSVLGGSLTASAPGLMSITGGIWTDAGGSASGTGTNRFNGGTLNLRTNIIPGLRLTGGTVYVTGATTFQEAGVITNLTLDGSQLRGTNVVSDGTLTINSGGVDGQLTVLSAGQVMLATSAAKNLYQLVMNNQGTVTWSDGVLLGGSTPGTVISNAGMWQITGDSTFYDAYGGPSMIWDNRGTLRKAAGTATTLISGFNLINQTTGLIQVDTGTLQLPSGFTNTSGTLRLNGGTLNANGTLGFIGGTLEGDGTLGANTLTGGTITPGQSGPGILRFNAGLNLSSNATVILSGTGTIPGTQYDQLSVIGAVSLDNATLQVTSLPNVPGGTTFTIIANDGTDPVNGTFNGLTENSSLNVGGQSFRIHYAGSSGNDVTLVRDALPPGAQLATTGGLTNGVWRFSGIGTPSGIYTIQATTNFIQWTNIGSATGDLSGNFNVADSNAFRFQYRFYRTTN
ncbi:MAG TPA: hypothetical protein VLU94_00715 [Candidatus Nitrosotalea sp.]|nr:hypothetical protein [Candidatus Nitrosotalea sp.]